VVLAAPGAALAGGPRYDVPAGFERCPDARAWNGFFKWASVRGASCARAGAFVRAYARHTNDGAMPRSVGGYRCRIRWWRNAEGEVYASRHTCTRGAVTVRFYGMV
jgi:hypothetical protein